MSQPPLPDRPTPVTDPVFNEWFAKQQADILWFLGQHEVLARYPGQVVVLHNRIIIGSGRDDLEALEEARRRAAQRGEPLPDACRMLFIPVQDPNSFSFGPGGLPFPPVAKRLPGENAAVDTASDNGA